MTLLRWCCRIQPGGATLINPTNTTVTILNNNFGVSFLNATNYVSETNSTGLIFVQRIGNPTNGFQVNYATTNGTALAGINYNTTTGALNFVSGEILKTISVPLINNQLTTNLAFGMTLSVPTSGAQLVAPSNTLVVLQAGAAGLSFTNSTMSIFKSSGVAVIPVVCSNPGIEPAIVNSNSVPLSVQYYTVDGTAVSGQDYTGQSGTLVFTNGAVTNSITVPISNNSLITGSRAFSVVLTNATAPGKITSPSNQVVTIIDNNSGLSFSSPTYTVQQDQRGRDDYHPPDGQHQYGLDGQLCHRQWHGRCRHGLYRDQRHLHFHQRRHQPDVLRDGDCRHNRSAG